jgi:hypothetical protein
VLDRETVLDAEAPEIVLDSATATMDLHGRHRTVP